jgi:hypothetical protein
MIKCKSFIGFLGAFFLLTIIGLAGCGPSDYRGGGDHYYNGPSGKYVFVTEEVFDGDLETAGGGYSGLEGADNICNDLAYYAGLGGVWKAWLSDSTTDAIDRIDDVGPWYLLDGTEVFYDKYDLVYGPFAPININEYGTTSYGNIAVWTGTLYDGTGSFDNCLDWSDNFIFEGSDGDLLSDTDCWTEADGSYACDYVPDTQGCDQTLALYCIEQ